MTETKYKYIHERIVKIIFIYRKLKFHKAILAATTSWCIDNIDMFFC